MPMKSWQVNEQVPALIKVSDFPDELTGGKKNKKTDTHKKQTNK